MKTIVTCFYKLTREHTKVTLSNQTTDDLHFVQFSSSLGAFLNIIIIVLDVMQELHVSLNSPLGFSHTDLVSKPPPDHQNLILNPLNSV